MDGEKGPLENIPIYLLYIEPITKPPMRSRGSFTAGFPRSPSTQPTVNGGQDGRRKRQRVSEGATRRIVSLKRLEC